MTISTPDAGYVVVTANGYLNVSHGASLDNVGMNVSTDPGQNVFTHGVSSFKIPGVLPEGGYREPFTCLRVFEVDGSSNLKVYLIARQASGANIASTDVAYPVIQATYYPTDYFPTILFPIKKSTGATQPVSTDGSNPER